MVTQKFYRKNSILFTVVLLCAIIMHLLVLHNIHLSVIYPQWNSLAEQHNIMCLNYLFNSYTMAVRDFSDYIHPETQGPQVRGLRVYTNTVMV